MVLTAYRKHKIYLAVIMGFGLGQIAQKKSLCTGNLRKPLKKRAMKKFSRELLEKTDRTLLGS